MKFSPEFRNRIENEVSFCGNLCLNFVMKQFATVTVIGRDKTGVIARVTNFLFEQHANVEALEEQVTRGQFSMTLQASWKKGEMKLDSLRNGLDELAQQIGHGNQIPPHRPAPAPALRHHGHEGDALLRRAAGREIEGRRRARHRQLSPISRRWRKKPGCRSSTSTGTTARRPRSRRCNLLEEHEIDFVVLARFMKILSPNFVWRFKNKIINIHPSLLPSFPGPQAYRQAYESGVKIAGVTAHFVSMRLDEGPIIAQGSFAIMPGMALKEHRRARPESRGRHARQGREIVSRQAAGRLLGRGEGSLRRGIFRRFVRAGLILSPILTIFRPAKYFFKNYSHS